MRIIPPSVVLLHCTPDPEGIIERAGRVCYRSEGRITLDSRGAFIRMLLDPGRKHESVLEHASAGFLIVTDRGVSHELVRHRLASFSQESTRYCNYAKERFGEEITVVRPVGIPADDQDPLAASWLGACRAAEAAYFALLQDGAPPQVARAVLPTCLKTELAMTASLREWRHILALRLAPAAHPDMRVIAGLLRDQLLERAPNVFRDFAP